MNDKTKRIDPVTERIGTAVLLVVVVTVVLILARTTELPMIARIVIGVLAGLVAAVITTASITAIRNRRQ